jgi:hypothetical protein
MNAACCAQLIQQLLEQLMATDLYADVPNVSYHMGLHKGFDALSKMYEANKIDSNELAEFIDAADALSLSEASNTLVLSEDVITVPDIQNRIILSLPEIIERDDDEEVLAYTVKGLSDKYRAKIQEQLESLDFPSAEP